MSPNLNFSTTLEAAGLSAWPLQPFNETDSVAAPFLNVGSYEQKAFPASEFPEWQAAYITPTGPRGSGNSIAPAAPEERNETRPMKSPERKSMTDAKNGGKKRIKCPHQDCNLTFPRLYELERHRKTIHSPNISIVCSVYGCNRISKPFPRLDKFYEHIRKHHKGPERFLCVLECCRQGPFTRAELVEHLNTRHSLKESEQLNLQDSLNALGLPGQFRQGGLILPENGNACPLKFLGCEYSHPPSSSAQKKTERHLEQHELLERSKGYEKIVAHIGLWSPNGIATCPICRQAKSYLFGIIVHVDSHTRKERGEHAVEIAQMFRPYLTGQEIITYKDYSYRITNWKLDPEFRARVEQSGVLSATSQQPEGNEVLPGNATGLQEMGF